MAEGEGGRQGGREERELDGEGEGEGGGEGNTRRERGRRRRGREYRKSGQTKRTATFSGEGEKLDESPHR